MAIATIYESLALACFLLISSLGSSSCGAAGIVTSPENPLAAQEALRQASQVLLVRNGNPAQAEVQIWALEKKKGEWRNFLGPLEGVIGRNGFAAPGRKREGDGRTPTGTFRLGTVFGYAPVFPTRMLYRQATVDDVWIDDVHADDYNRWVKRGETRAASFERMLRNDDLYKLGIVVEYNTDPVIKGKGSAIFFHLWKEKGVATDGCIALAEADLRRIAGWLDPAAMPVVIMGTNATFGGY